MCTSSQNKYGSREIRGEQLLSGLKWRLRYYQVLYQVLVEKSRTGETLVDYFCTSQ